MFGTRQIIHLYKVSYLTGCRGALETSSEITTSEITASKITTPKVSSVSTKPVQGLAEEQTTRKTTKQREGSAASEASAASLTWGRIYGSMVSTGGDNARVLLVVSLLLLLVLLLLEHHLSPTLLPLSPSE
jgi:hypothetical protein